MILELVDKVETIKGLVIGKLQSERTMLQNALDAITKNKLYVTRDHIERVLNTFDDLECKLKIL